MGANDEEEDRMGWVVWVVLLLVLATAIAAIELRGQRKRATEGPRQLEAGADPDRDGKHPPYGSWLGGTGS